MFSTVLTLARYGLRGLFISFVVVSACGDGDAAGSTVDGGSASMASAGSEGGGGGDGCTIKLTADEASSVESVSRPCGAKASYDIKADQGRVTVVDGSHDVGAIIVFKGMPMTATETSSTIDYSASEGAGDDQVALLCNSGDLWGPTQGNNMIIIGKNRFKLTLTTLMDKNPEAASNPNRLSIQYEVHGKLHVDCAHTGNGPGVVSIDATF